jgi:hypothetical protein
MKVVLNKAELTKIIGDYIRDPRGQGALRMDQLTFEALDARGGLCTVDMVSVIIDVTMPADWGPEGRVMDRPR